METKKTPKFALVGLLIVVFALLASVGSFAAEDQFIMSTPEGNYFVWNCHNSVSSTQYLHVFHLGNDGLFDQYQERSVVRFDESNSDGTVVVPLLPNETQLGLVWSSSSSNPSRVDDVIDLSSLSVVQYESMEITESNYPIQKLVQHIVGIPTTEKQANILFFGSTAIVVLGCMTLFIWLREHI